jgi:LmbE family N-acetylglucosaminyl deacetylase
VPRPGPVGPLWVRLRTARARDATAELVPGSALVVSPHPDDETIACGLLLAAKASRGIPVSVVLATDGGLGWFGDGPAPTPARLAAVRSAEWHAALDAMGVPTDARHELRHPDGGLADHEAAAASELAGIVTAVAPDQVYLPAPDDLHADHRALARATLAAVGALDSAARPALWTYRVYPEAGLWPDGDSGGSSAAGAAWRLVRSAPTLVRHPDRALHAPGSVAAKRLAVDAYVSQRRLLGSGVRSVWGTGIELFRPVHTPVT